MVESINISRNSCRMKRQMKFTCTSSIEKGSIEEVRNYADRYCAEISSDSVVAALQWYLKASRRGGLVSISDQFLIRTVMQAEIEEWVNEEGSTEECSAMQVAKHY